MSSLHPPLFMFNIIKYNLHNKKVDVMHAKLRYAVGGAKKGKHSIRTYVQKYVQTNEQNRQKVEHEI